VTEADCQRVAAHRLNAGVLAYLGRDGHLPVVAPPESHDDPYLRAGSHPDVVLRVWDEIGGSSPAAERCLLHGTPGLVHRQSGLVLAVALGTSYAVRLAPAELREALRAGASTEHHYTTVDITLNLPSTFGDGWVFGGWHRDEPTWCASTCQALAELG
jgi:hypothetical protein